MAAWCSTRQCSLAAVYNTGHVDIQVPHPSGTPRQELRLQTNLRSALRSGGLLTLTKDKLRAGSEDKVPNLQWKPWPAEKRARELVAKRWPEISGVEWPEAYGEITHVPRFPVGLRRRC